MDVALVYGEGIGPKMELADLPDSSWPRPRPHRYPFNGSLVDYMRPIAPGMFVGCGWKEKPMSGLVGERFLTFILVRIDDSRMGNWEV